MNRPTTTWWELVVIDEYGGISYEGARDMSEAEARKEVLEELGFGVNIHPIEVE